MIEQFIDGLSDSELSYPEIGATNDVIPNGYITDHNRQKLSGTPDDLQFAIDAIRTWQMFAFDWVTLHKTNTPIKVGQNVAILIRHFGFYSLNSARIVYTIDENDRFGFAYGTLTEHGEIGEERFTVERDPTTGEIWYDLLAFSRPGNIAAKIGYPIVRSLQKQFASDSKNAMLRAFERLKDEAR